MIASDREGVDAQAGLTDEDVDRVRPIGQRADRHVLGHLRPNREVDAVDREGHGNVVAVVVQRDDDLAVGDPAIGINTGCCRGDGRRLVTVDGHRLGEVVGALRDGDGLCAVEQARERDRQVGVGRHDVVGALHRERQRQLAADVAERDDDHAVFVGAAHGDIGCRLAGAIAVDGDGEALVGAVHRERHQVAAISQAGERDDLGGTRCQCVGDAVEHEHGVEVVTIVDHGDLDVAVAVRTRLDVAVRRGEITIHREGLGVVLAVSGDGDRVGSVAEAAVGAGGAGADADRHIFDDAGVRVGDVEDHCLGALIGEGDGDGAVVVVAAHHCAGHLGERVIAVDREGLREVGGADLDGDRVGTIGKSAERARCSGVGVDRDMLDDQGGRVGDIEHHGLAAGVLQGDDDLAITVRAGHDARDCRDR